MEVAVAVASHVLVVLERQTGLLYEKYRQSIEDYILSKVLPPLSVQQAEPFLRALIQSWSSHKEMVECLYFPQNGLAPLKETGLTCFRDLVYQKIKGQAKNAVIALIKKEDDGDQNNRDLIKCVLDIFAENGLDQLDCQDFEDFFLKILTDFYVKAQNWILKDSRSDNMIETAQYLKLEEGRVSHYLHINCNEHKLLEETLNILFAQLLVEEPSKCFAFLRDNKVEELCKMHKLFKNIHRLPKLCNIFKMHLRNQVTCLISQAEYPARNKEALLWEIVELHVKHAIHVTKCFQDDTLFLKALRDSASRIWSTELPATIFENSIMNSGGSVNLCNQAKEVYQEIKGKVNDVLNYLINEQLMRIKILVNKNMLEGEKILEGENILEGEKICMALLSKYLDMLSNIEPDCYEADFVVPLLKSITDFYSEKAPLLFRENPPPNVYVEKVEVFSELEIERSRRYSPFDIKHIILKDVTYVLLARYLEALLRGNKVEDLSRMYIHALGICGLPESIADMLKMHLTNEITVLVRQAAQDFYSDKKKYSKVNYIQPKEEDAFAAQVFLWKILDLHDKYGNLITKYFGGHAAFRKALKEVFELVCTNGVSGISGAELFAICCENILKCLTKKLSDQDGVGKKLNGDVGPYEDALDNDVGTYEDALDKITRLIPYNRDKDLFVKFYSDKLERGLQGCFAFLLDARVKCLRSLYTLFSKISGGLEPLVDMFKKHLMSEIGDMTKREKDPVNYKVNYIQPKEEDAFAAQDFLWKILDLHDKYGNLITKYFGGHAAFRKALKEVFELVCTNGVSGISGAELFAICCENILKCLTKKLSDQDGVGKKLNGDVGPYEDALDNDVGTYEDALDKITRLIPYNRDKDLFVKFYSDKLERGLQGCFAFLLDARVKCLRSLYTLFSKISGGLKPLIDMFKKHVTSEFGDMIKGEEDPLNNKDLVCKIIELYERFEARAMQCFQGHRGFCKALKEAFGDLCTRGVSGSSMAELLATFCDNILKKGCNEKLSDEDIRGDVDKVVKMLAFINEKDLFAKFYRKKLATRLLSNVSVHQERWFLEKLDQQCGFHLTSKMKRMIADITISRDNEDKFKEVVATHPLLNPEMDLSVSVLTAGLWPRMPSFDMNLPAEMVKYVEVFKEFYQTRTKKAKLTWLYSMGTCNVNAKFEVGDIELIVTPSQAALLLPFNESDRLSYSEMVTQLKLPHDVAMPLFHSLCCGSYKILNKEPANGYISPDDVFEFNSKFTIGMKRIKIPPPLGDTKNVVAENVEKDRSYQIEASIVRIMKSRKVMAHELLVRECEDQLSRWFKPDVKDIKKRIYDLITREYLERDKENPNLYKYLA